MKMKLRCPKDATHKRFGTTAHVMQSWVVDEEGEYVETTNDCLEVTSPPDFVYNTVNCAICGADAEGED
jgi:hypothetical protein